MKKILFAIGLIAALCVTSVQAASTVFALTGVNNTNFVVKGPLKLQSIYVSSNSATNGQITFFDSPSAFTTNFASAFTNIIRTVFTTNQIFTNIFGVTSTNTFPMIAQTTNTVAAGMQQYDVIASVITVSNATPTLLPFSSRYVANGILCSNLSTIGGAPGGVVITFNYDLIR